MLGDESSSRVASDFFCQSIYKIFRIAITLMFTGRVRRSNELDSLQINLEIHVKLAQIETGYMRNRCGKASSETKACTNVPEEAEHAIVTQININRAIRNIDKSIFSTVMALNRQIDLGSMALYDSNAVALGSTSEQTIENITQHLVENVKFIFTHLLQIKKQEINQVEILPQEQQIIDFQRSELSIKLPEPTTIFPRSRKLPEQKALTKWQRFAKEKGIKKRKDAGMKYDPTLKTQVAKWGKRSKKNAIEIPILEEKQPGRNPFDDIRTQKKLRREKNKLKQLKNKERHIKK